MLHSCYSGRLTVCLSILFVEPANLLKYFHVTAFPRGLKGRCFRWEKAKHRGVECLLKVHRCKWQSLGRTGLSWVLALGSLQEATVPPEAWHKWLLPLLASLPSKVPDSTEECRVAGIWSTPPCKFFHKWEIWLSAILWIIILPESAS